jgi:hypothetical protein
MSKKDFKEYWIEQNKTKTYFQALISCSNLITKTIQNKSEEKTLEIALQETFEIDKWDKSHYTELIEKYEEKADKDKCRTEANTIKIVQKMAQLLRNGKPFIDWALGFGNSLIGLDGEIFGQDINSDLIEIASANLLINNVSPKNIQQGDSLESPLKKDGVIFFDPPMGGQHTKPDKWNDKKTKEILGSTTGKTAPELLFLTSFFLHASKDSYFIGLFPESIISKINNEAVNLRKFLIRHSLMGLIKLESLVLIVGKGIEWISEVKAKELSKEDEIPIIRFKNNFPFASFLSKTHTSFDNFLCELGTENLKRIYKREELKKDNYVIELPYEINQKEHLSLSEIRIKLESSLSSIQSEYENLNSEIKDDLLIETHRRESEPEAKNTDWFLKIEDKSDNLKTILKRLYDTRIIQEVESNICTLYLELYEIDRVDYFSALISDLQELYKNHRLKVNESKVIQISISEITSFEKYSKPFEEFILPENYYSKIFTLFNNKEKAIFRNLSEYWLFRNQDRTYIETKTYTISEIISAIKLFKTLGLVKSTTEQDFYIKGLIEIYNSNRIYHPLIDGGL